MAQDKVNPFRSPVSNVRYTKALFYEWADATKEGVVYTLKDSDHMGYPSLYRLYMEMDDPTEYEFANKYLDGWEHWEILCASNWFKAYINRWRKELDLKMKAKALAVIRNEANNGGKNALAASKYLMERGWEPKQEKLTKAQMQQIRQDADSVTFEKKELEETAKRIGLN